MNAWSARPITLVNLVNIPTCWVYHLKGPRLWSINMSTDTKTVLQLRHAFIAPDKVEYSGKASFGGMQDHLVLRAATSQSIDAS
jgi:hypothetical protein